MEKLNRPYFLAVSGGLAALITLFASPALSIALGPEGRGTVYAALAASVMGTTFLSFGSSTSLRIEYAQSQGRLGNKFVSHFLIALLISLIIAFSFDSLIGNPVMTLDLLLPLAVATAANVSTANFSSILVAKHHYLSIAALSLFMPIGQLLAAAIVTWSSVDPALAVVAAFCMSSLVSLTYSNLVSWQYRVQETTRIPHSFSSSGKNLASSLLGTLATRLDLLLVSLWLGVGFGGQYSLALMVALPVFLSQGAVLNSYLNGYIDSFRNDLEGSIEQARIAVRGALSLAMALALVSTVLGLVFLEPIFGPQFVDARSLIVPLSIAAVGSVMAMFTSDLLIASNQGSKVFFSTAIITTAFVLCSAYQALTDFEFLPYLVMAWYWLIFGWNVRLLKIRAAAIFPSLSSLRASLKQLISKPKDMR